MIQNVWCHLLNSIYNLQLVKAVENVLHVELDFIPDAVLTYEQFRADIDRKNYDIQLGYTIRADVTDFSTVDYDAILKEILESDASLK